MNPDPALLRDYSKEAQDMEPFVPPYIAHFQKGSRNLYYVASFHQVGVESPTFKTVAEAFELARPQLVVVEGMPTSAGPSPSFFIDYAERHARQGFIHEGEQVYAAHLAHGRGVPFIGGEPRNRDIYEIMSGKGYTTKDMMAFELLRFIPIWRQHGILDTADFSRQAGEYLRDPSWFDVPTKRRLTFRQFESWYGVHGDLGKPFLDVEAEDLAPLAEGNYFERLSRELNAIRDWNAVQAIAKALAAHDRVLAVFGGAHLVAARRVFESLLGDARHLKLY
jgi:hypothetical protein